MKHFLSVVALSVATIASAAASAPVGTSRFAPGTGSEIRLESQNKASVKASRPLRATDVAITPPYTATFTQDDGLNKYTVIDANGDGKTWKYSNKEAVINYNSNLDMDDWLITQPVRLEAGMEYSFSILTRCADTGTVERMGVYVGAAPTVEAMTTTVIPVTEVATVNSKKDLDSYQANTGSFTATSTGLYYLGIHGCSEKDQWSLFVRQFTIEAVGAATLPSAVTELTGAPDPDAGLSATISFKAPATDSEGNPLTTIDRIDVTRNGEHVKDFTGVAAGQECTASDVVSESGMYTYTVTPVIGGREGTAMSVNVFIGMAKPASPTGVELVETESDGMVTLSWDAVNTNEYGHTINPSLVTYTITSAADESQEIASGITGTSHTFRAISANSQTFVEYNVTAVTEAGASAPTISPLVAVGKPYALPMELRVNSAMYLTHNITAWGNWSIAPLSTDLDEDGFVLRLTPENGTVASLGSGKVAIPADARNPIFTFFYYTWKTTSGGPSTDVAYAVVNGQRVEGAVFPLGDSDGWRSAVIPLDAYKGTSVIVGIEVETHPLATGMGYYPLFDGFTVKDPYASDLELKAFAIPSQMKTGRDESITATVRNIGATDAGAFSVELRRDGKVVDTKNIGSLTASSSTTVVFTEHPGVNWPESVTYTIAVNYAADENPADNTGAEIVTDIIFPDYPVAENLVADTQADGSVVLTWAAPALSSEPEAIAESFENCQSFAINDANDWTFIDVDGARTYSFGGDDTFPGQFSPMAYIVFDASAFESEDYAAHTGDKYLGSFAATSGLNDDWLISPLLPGTEQTVTVYARSYNDKYGLETFEFLTTELAEGFTTESFTYVDRVVVPVTWKKCTFTVPAGARHFAIRCTSEDKFFFMLDDISYTRAAQTERYIIQGYNIYRDGECINSEPVTELTFTDTSASGSRAMDTVYNVSTVYTAGESCLSEAATDNSGVESVAAAQQAAITAGEGIIIVAGAEAGSDISVFTTSGIMAAKATADAAGAAAINVAPGIYVVRTSAVTSAVIVR